MYEEVKLSSSPFTAYLERHNRQQFQNEGHFVNTPLPRNAACSACKADKPHREEDLVNHSLDPVYTLTLYTPGCNPDSPKDTGIQILRVMANQREDVIKMMADSIRDAIFAYARGEVARKATAEDFSRINYERNLLHTFIADNFDVPPGVTPVDMAVDVMKMALKQQGKEIKLSDKLPDRWRR